MKYFSYLRKSTSPQIFSRQLKQLTDFCIKEGILPKNYSSEKDEDLTDLKKYVELVTESRSGLDQNRPLLNKLIETMKYERTKDDVCLLLVECTRLGRSYEGNCNLFHQLKQHDIKFVVVTCADLLDTRIKHNNPATALISDIVLAVFNWLAEQEHITTQERCQAGREEAKKRGVAFGRKTMTIDTLPVEFIKVINSKDNEKKTKQELLEALNGKLLTTKKKPISRATFYTYLKIYNEAQQHETK